MTRFVHLLNNCDEMLINTRAIVGVSNLGDENVTVELFDGTTHRVNCAFLREIVGDDAIVQIYPCKHISAVYAQKYAENTSARVAFIALTASGKLRPLDCFYKFMDVPNDGTEYLELGFTKDFR